MVNDFLLLAPVGLSLVPSLFAWHVNVTNELIIASENLFHESIICCNYYLLFLMSEW